MNGMDKEYLTGFIFGGLNELAWNISNSDSFLLKEVESSIRMLLEGIKENG